VTQDGIATLAGWGGRWVVTAGVAICAGAVTFQMFILPRVSFGPVPAAQVRRQLTTRAARLGGTGAVLVVVGAGLRLWEQARTFADPYEPLADEMSLLVFGTSWGFGWIGQIAAGALAAGAFWLARRESAIRAETGWFLALLAVVALAFAPAMVSHALVSEHFVVPGVVAHVIHVVAASVWIGSLAVIGWVATDLGKWPGRRLPVGWLVSTVAAFSPLALGCAVVLAATGAFASWLHVREPALLFSDPYGQRLLAKLALVCVMAGFGFWNWRRARGRIAESGRLPRQVWVELGLALAILGVTASLVVTPPPAHQGLDSEQAAGALRRDRPVACRADLGLEFLCSQTCPRRSAAHGVQCGPVSPGGSRRPDGAA